LTAYGVYKALGSTDKFGRDISLISRRYCNELHPPKLALAQDGSSATRKYIVVFPGQGAQMVGMAAGILKIPNSTSYKLFMAANSILGYDLLKICSSGTNEELSRADICQSAIFVTSLAALEELKTFTPIHKFCVGTAGLSLGEYTALVFAGCISFEEGLKLVNIRAKAMQQCVDTQPPTAMVSVIGLNETTTHEIVKQLSEIDPYVTIANYLAADNLVLSGRRDSCEKAVVLAKAKGARLAKVLNVAGAYHSKYMSQAQAPLSDALGQIRLLPSQIPVFSNVDSKPHSGDYEIKVKLIEQVIAPVMWEQCMDSLLEIAHPSSTTDLVVWEVGPGRVLSGLLSRRMKRADFPYKSGIEVNNYTI